MKVQRFLLPALATACAAVACLCATASVAYASSHAATPRVDRGLFDAEQTPLKLTSTKTATHAASSSGTSVLRTIIGLLVVIVLIYSIAWVMRRVRRGREGKVSGSGLATVATLPLGGGRSLHLVRAANDLILVGASEHGVSAIRTYSENEARAIGLLGEQPPALGELASGEATTWEPAPPWQEADEWRALNERPTPIAQALEQLRRRTVR